MLASEVLLREAVYQTDTIGPQQVPERDVARVADDALVFRDGQVYVPTVRNDHLQLAEVVLGFDDGRSVEILDGISDDDVIALNVGQAVQEGDAVQPVPVQASAGQTVTAASGQASTQAAPAS